MCPMFEEYSKVFFGAVDGEALKSNVEPIFRELAHTNYKTVWQKRLKYFSQCPNIIFAIVFCKLNNEVGVVKCLRDLAPTESFPPTRITTKS